MSGKYFLPKLRLYILFSSSQNQHPLGRGWQCKKWNSDFAQLLHRRGDHITENDFPRDNEL